MPKYHDQDIINSRVALINKAPQRAAIIEDLKSLKEEAAYEVSRINLYTAPEEIKRRKDSLAYYEDMLERLEVKE